MSDNVQEVTRNYNSIMAKLEPALDPGATATKRMLDNAAGCVSRMIKRHPDRVPLPEVLPRLLELLPAKEEHEENGPAFQCVVQLCE